MMLNSKMHSSFITNATVKTLLIAFKTRRAWWFTASARTQERFARTTLGSFWLGLSNLLSISVLAVVYGKVFKVTNFNEYVVFLGLGLVIWNGIASALTSAPHLFRVNASNIKNTSLDPIFFALEEWSFQMQSVMQSFTLVVIGLSMFNHSLVSNLLTHGLLPFINMALFVFWMPLLLCLLGAELEDLYQLIPIALQLGFLLSPILYQKSALGSLMWTANINPMVLIIDGIRDAMITGKGNLGNALIILLANLAGCIMSIVLLNKRRHALPFLV